MKIELKDLSNLELLKEYKYYLTFLIQEKNADRRNNIDLEKNPRLDYIQEEISSRMTQPEVVKLKVK